MITKTLAARFFAITALTVPLTFLAATTATAAPAAAVPVVVCDTSSGGPPLTPAPLPSNADVPVGDRNLEVYSLVAGSFQVLAPRTMGCEGTVGADGTTLISVGPNEPTGPWAAPAVGVTAYVIPACYGCMLDLACPFFPVAAQLLEKGYGNMQCTPQPKGQSVYRLGSDAVAFSDPPGEYVPTLDRALVPNDSPYPTNGVVLFYRVPLVHRPRRSQPPWRLHWTALDAVCVLPASGHHVCTEVLNEFVATHGRITNR
jgi:hypothetical protein